MHDFNGHEVNGIHGLNGKKCYDKALYLVNNRHDFKGMHDFKGNFPYDDFFRKTHARLYAETNSNPWWQHYDNTLIETPGPQDPLSLINIRIASMRLAPKAFMAGSKVCH